MNKYFKHILDNDPSAKSILHIILFHPGFKAIFWYKIATFIYYKLRIKFIAYFIMYIVRRRTGIEIHPAAKIGKRLFIDHGMGVVIGETCIIGDDCIICQGVTLGATKNIKSKRHPTLGNNVIVGANSCILGNIVIGNNCKIGSGTIVLNDLEDGSVIVGEKGKIIKTGKE